MLLEELTTVWLNDAKERLRDSSYASYRASIARVLKYFGSQDIKTIHKNNLKDAEKKLVESGGSYQTSRMMFNVLRLSLEYAQIAWESPVSQSGARGFPVRFRGYS